MSKAKLLLGVTVHAYNSSTPALQNGVGGGGAEAGGLQVLNLVCRPEILANGEKCKEWPIPGALFTKNDLAGVTPHLVTFYS